jgi:hypothetical protein
MLLEGLGQLKSPMTSSGIEPVTFRCLNQLRCCVPPVEVRCVKFGTEIGCMYLTVLYISIVKGSDSGVLC